MKLLDRRALIVRARGPHIRWECTRGAESARPEKHIVGNVSVYVLDENLRAE